MGHPTAHPPVWQVERGKFSTRAEMGGADRTEL